MGIFGVDVLTSSGTAEKYVLQELPPLLWPEKEPRRYFWKPPTKRASSGRERDSEQFKQLIRAACVHSLRNVELSKKKKKKEKRAGDNILLLFQQRPLPEPDALENCDLSHIPRFLLAAAPQEVWAAKGQWLTSPPFKENTHQPNKPGIMPVN